MSIDRRLKSIEQRLVTEPPVRFVFAGTLERGQVPTPGAFTITIDDGKAHDAER